MYINREEAGNLLAEKLINYKNSKNTIIVAIPRGGVPIGYEIAEKLNLPLEIVLSKKIGHPFNKEFAIGAVTLESRILSDEADTVSKEYIEEETERIRNLLKKRVELYYENKKQLNFNDKVIILVDDGIATGNTLISCIELISQQKPSKIIVALPVAPSSSLEKINKLSVVNNTICLLVPRNFQAVGQFYEEFYQVSDNEVVELLKKANDKFISKKIS